MRKILQKENKMETQCEIQVKVSPLFLNGDTPSSFVRYECEDQFSVQGVTQKFNSERNTVIFNKLESTL